MPLNYFYRIADVLAGAIVGVSVVAVDHLAMAPGLPWPTEFAAGMLLAMVTQAVVTRLLGSMLGNLEMALPGFVAAMVVMFVPWLPIGSLQNRLLAGALLGATIFGVFEILDLILRERAFPSRRERLRRFATIRGQWRAAIYDFFEGAGSRRRAWVQSRLFGDVQGTSLFVGVGTGLNLVNLTAGTDVELTIVDIDPDFLASAEKRAAQQGVLCRTQVADAEDLPFANNCFDTVICVATLCSVGSPKAALREFRRVLKPGGQLLLFEHVQSSHWLLRPIMTMMERLSLSGSPSITRDTVEDLAAAGFITSRLACGYLDVYLAIWSVKPADSALELRNGKQRTTAAVA